MARCRPDLADFHPTSAGEAREGEVLARLTAGLPEDYLIFHGVGWSSVKNDRQHFGEIDAIVLAPNGNLLLMEIKAGPVEVGPEGIRKRYNDRSKDVLAQVGVQFAALCQRLKQAGLTAYMAQLLVLPDQAVAGGSVGYPRERIVDHAEMPLLCERVLAAMPQKLAVRPDAARLAAFLDDLFALAPDPTLRIGWLSERITRLSEGLATWVPRLSLPGGRLHIEAAAGAGKTQLALALLNAAHQAGEHATYVCFNRSLADHMRRLLPPPVRVATVHELAIEQWRDSGAPLDFTHQQTQFDAAVAAWESTEARPQWELMVIDEMQDLAARWVERLLGEGLPDGRAYLLGDEAQRLILDRPAWQRVDCARLTCPDNFRSPRQVVRVIQALGLSRQPLVARGPIEGGIPGFHVWPGNDDSQGLAMTTEVVQGLLQEGIAADHIVLLTLRGRERSRLLQQEQIAGLALRRFSHYHPNGDAVWRPGALLADTVSRFKGQSAPVVVLTEIDFEVLDERAVRLLYVGMTRAEWRIECVLSVAAERALMAGAERGGLLQPQPHAAL